MSADEVNYFGANPHLGDAVERINSESESKRAQEDVPIPEMFANGVPRSYTVDTLPRDAWVEVDLGAIAHNVKVAHRHLGSRRHLLAVVKADGYGHGAVQVARKTALERPGAEYLGGGHGRTRPSSCARRWHERALSSFCAQPPDCAPSRCCWPTRSCRRSTHVRVRASATPRPPTPVRDVRARTTCGVEHGHEPHRRASTSRSWISCSQINFHRGAASSTGTFTHFATADEAQRLGFPACSSSASGSQAIQLMRAARASTPASSTAPNSAAIQPLSRGVASTWGASASRCTAWLPVPRVLRGVDRPHARDAASNARITVPQGRCQLGEGVSYGLNYRSCQAGADLRPSRSAMPTACAASSRAR